jgi:hypothetical protein
MVKRFYEEKMMTKKRQLKLVHVGEYVAEVEVELVYTDEGWSPYLSLSDALKLDEVRELLRQGEVGCGPFGSGFQTHTCSSVILEVITGLHEKNV